jgi:hypothetical protein
MLWLDVGFHWIGESACFHPAVFLSATRLRLEPLMRGRVCIGVIPGYCIKGGGRTGEACNTVKVVILFSLF